MWLVDRHVEHAPLRVEAGSIFVRTESADQNLWLTGDFVRTSETLADQDLFTFDQKLWPTKIFSDRPTLWATWKFHFLLGNPGRPELFQNVRLWPS